MALYHRVGRSSTLLIYRVQLVLAVLREALGLLPVLPMEDRGRQKHPESQIRVGPEDHS